MTDIVQDLRDAFIVGDIAVWNILVDAANEIERLRSRLEVMEAALRVIILGAKDSASIEIARAALDKDEAK